MHARREQQNKGLARALKELERGMVVEMTPEAFNNGGKKYIGRHGVLVHIDPKIGFGFVHVEDPEGVAEVRVELWGLRPVKK